VSSDSYSGDLTARESWDLLERDAKAVLVDVRSQAEWEFVGVPDIEELRKSVVLVPWQVYPGMRSNTGFADQLRAAGVSGEGAVIFLCRSGARSKAAAIAMTAQGYARCYNLAGGFEGPHDGRRHRGAVDGWKAAGLPWTQG
jgi:rhodanese-related sulfurtransferase